LEITTEYKGGNGLVDGIEEGDLVPSPSRRNIFLLAHSAPNRNQKKKRYEMLFINAYIAYLLLTSKTHIPEPNF
jgi:hypothetical protein